MKKYHHVGSQRSGVESSPAAAPMFPRPQRPTFNARLAFTLIELLTVIGIIAVLASLTFPILGSVKRHEYISKTQAELAQLETAIDSYKAAYGFYPPDNPASSTSPLVSQLYFELLGTRLTNNGTLYITLDGSVPITTNDVPLAFPGVGGFINCTKPGAGEDAPAAKNFLPNLKPNQFTTTYTNNGVQVGLLLASVGGPDANYNPLGQLPPPPYLNPWRYNSSSPTNNPGAYDLWVELKIGGKTNLICNWSKQVQINSPLP
jgi:prepilin-type N-terminal cleavage/methylation domain-containing protein